MGRVSGLSILEIRKSIIWSIYAKLEQHEALQWVNMGPGIGGKLERVLKNHHMFSNNYFFEYNSDIYNYSPLNSSMKKTLVLVTVNSACTLYCTFVLRKKQKSFVWNARISKDMGS